MRTSSSSSTPVTSENTALYWVCGPKLPLLSSIARKPVHTTVNTKNSTTPTKALPDALSRIGAHLRSSQHGGHHENAHIGNVIGLDIQAAGKERTQLFALLRRVDGV